MYWTVNLSRTEITVISQTYMTLMSDKNAKTHRHAEDDNDVQRSIT